jgi:toxin-antitoxin system PIN domain toxin
MYLPDINYWVAFTFHSHPHHASARTWFNNVLAPRILYFCRETQKGFLRLSNNPRVLPNYTLTQSQAWQQYDTYLLDPKIDYAQEPQHVESLWRQLTKGAMYSPNVWNDAYLAAFAISGGYELVTFDNGFTQYQAAGLKCTILT